MGEIDYLAASVYLLNIGRSLMEPGCEALPLTKAHFGGERWRHLGWGQVDILGPEVSSPQVGADFSAQSHTAGRRSAQVPSTPFSPQMLAPSSARGAQDPDSHL